MQQWEYLFVFAAIASGGDEFRPRFANDQELDDWQAGPTMYEYANRLEYSPQIFLQHNLFSIIRRGERDRPRHRRRTMKGSTKGSNLGRLCFLH